MRIKSSVGLFGEDWAQSVEARVNRLRSRRDLDVKGTLGIFTTFQFL